MRFFMHECGPKASAGAAADLGLGKSDFLRLDFAEDVTLERARRAEELLLGKIEREPLVKAMTDQFDRADEVCHLKHPAVLLAHALLPDDRTGTTFGNPIAQGEDVPPHHGDSDLRPCRKNYSKCAARSARGWSAR